jgi:hypothetical protein
VELTQSYSDYKVEMEKEMRQLKGQLRELHDNPQANDGTSTLTPENIHAWTQSAIKQEMGKFKHEEYKPFTKSVEPLFKMPGTEKSVTQAVQHVEKKLATVNGRIDDLRNKLGQSGSVPTTESELGSAQRQRLTELGAKVQTNNEEVSQFRHNTKQELEDVRALIDNKYKILASKDEALQAQQDRTAERLGAAEELQQHTVQRVERVENVQKRAAWNNAQPIAAVNIASNMAQLQDERQADARKRRNKEKMKKRLAKLRELSKKPLVYVSLLGGKKVADINRQQVLDVINAAVQPDAAPDARPAAISIMPTKSNSNAKVMFRSAEFTEGEKLTAWMEAAKDVLAPLDIEQWYPAKVHFIDAKIESPTELQEILETKNDDHQHQQLKLCAPPRPLKRIEPNDGKKWRTWIVHFRSNPIRIHFMIHGISGPSGGQHRVDLYTLERPVRPPAEQLKDTSAAEQAESEAPQEGVPPTMPVEEAQVPVEEAQVEANVNTPYQSEDELNVQTATATPSQSDSDSDNEFQTPAASQTQTNTNNDDENK